jgi:hypothetical protein
MAIRRVNEYKKEVETKTVELLNKLSEMGVDVAKAKLVDMGAVLSGELHQSIHAYYSPTLNAAYVAVTNKHAVYVEFGTGPRGAESPHPSGNGQYKDEGWWTKADDKDMGSLYGWQSLILPNDDIIYYTEGQVAKPFLYETAKQLENEIERVAKEVFA